MCDDKCIEVDLLDNMCIHTYTHTHTHTHTHIHSTHTAHTEIYHVAWGRRETL